jgi:hypothetical protein
VVVEAKVALEEKVAKEMEASAALITLDRGARERKTYESHMFSKHHNSPQTTILPLVLRCMTHQSAPTKIAQPIMVFQVAIPSATAPQCERNHFALIFGNSRDADSTTSKTRTRTEKTNRVEADVKHYKNHTTIIYHYSHHPNYHSTN